MNIYNILLLLDYVYDEVGTKQCSFLLRLCHAMFFVRPECLIVLNEYLKAIILLIMSIYYSNFESNWLAKL